MADFATLRDRMVEVHLVRRGIRDRRVIEAMRTVPRERFVDEPLAAFAYRDSPLSIGEGQTISQPYIVAAMIEAAAIEPGDRVLEVGAGSGYAAAVLGRIAREVIAIERHRTLGERARRRIADLGYANVDLRIADGTMGLAAEAPFDAILVSAAGPAIPEALKQQLAMGGRLVIPVGEPGEQMLCKVTRLDDDRFEAKNVGAVMFVPLIGAQGWQEDGAPPLAP